MSRYDFSDGPYGGSRGGYGGGYGSYYGRPQTLADHYEQHAEEREAAARRAQMRRQLEDEEAEQDFDYRRSSAASSSQGVSKSSGDIGSSYPGGNGLAVGNYYEEQQAAAAAEAEAEYAARMTGGRAGSSSRAYSSGAPPVPHDEIGSLLKSIEFDPSLRGLVTGIYGRPKFNAVPQPKMSGKPFNPEEHSWERPMHNGTAEDPREQTINRAAQALLEASRPPAVPVKEHHVPAIETVVHRKPAWRIEEELREMERELLAQPAPLKKGYNPDAEKKKLQVMFTFKGGKALPDSALPEALPGHIPLHLITGKRSGAGSRAGAAGGGAGRSKEEIVAALGLPASEARLLMVATQDELTLVAEAQATLREVKDGILDLRRHLSELSSVGAVDGGYLRGVEGDLADKTREMGRINALVADVRGRLVERAEAQAAAQAQKEREEERARAKGRGAMSAGPASSRGSTAQEEQPVNDALDSHLGRHYVNTSSSSGSHSGRPASGVSVSTSSSAYGAHHRPQSHQQQQQQGRPSSQATASSSSKPPAVPGRGRPTAGSGVASAEAPSSSSFGPVGVSMSRVGGAGAGGGVVVAGPEGRARMTVPANAPHGPRTRITPSPLRAPSAGGHTASSAPMGRRR